MSKHCVGCIYYLKDPTAIYGLTHWYCEKYDRRETFPGKGCDDFIAKEDRYGKYIYIEVENE